MANFPMQQSQYELLHEIGRGANTRIYMARCVPNNRLVAIRIVDLDGPVDFGSIRTGVSIWTTTKHPNLISYYGSFVHGASLWAIFEFLDCGSTYDILRFHNPSGFRDEVFIATILKSVLMFLSYFHKCNGIHRNLKSKYILVSTQGEVKVAGLWTAANLIQNGIRKETTFTNIGITPYTAPEIVNGHGYTQKVDIWSVGMVALELATGKPLFHNATELELVEKLVKWRFELPESLHVSKQFESFLRCCLSEDPSKRSSAVDLLNHKFIKLASDARYIATAMTGVVPISQRTKRGSFSQIELRKNAKCHIVFDFGDVPSNPITMGEPDASLGVNKTKTEVVRKGRFTLRVNVNAQPQKTKPVRRATS